VSKIKLRHSPLVHLLEIVWNVVIEGITTVETDENVCARLKITAKKFIKIKLPFLDPKAPYLPDIVERAA